MRTRVLSAGLMRVVREDRTCLICQHVHCALCGVSCTALVCLCSFYRVVVGGGGGGETAEKNLCTHRYTGTQNIDDLAQAPTPGTIFPAIPPGHTTGMYPCTFVNQDVELNKKGCLKHMYTEVIGRALF